MSLPPSKNDPTIDVAFSRGLRENTRKHVDCQVSTIYKINASFDGFIGGTIAIR